MSLFTRYLKGHGVMTRKCRLSYDCDQCTMAVHRMESFITVLSPHGLDIKGCTVYNAHQFARNFWYIVILYALLLRYNALHSAQYTYGHPSI